ncbi:hypothetical protein HGRIS_005260 [Hohenbuehelia grisea]|uniref:Uncharacterized protein n=1 Tax=Hohenbuehelia grisea TaxID=104357 RepID=A0ABR3JEP9_9AGAR
MTPYLSTSQSAPNPSIVYQAAHGHSSYYSQGGSAASQPNQSPSGYPGQGNYYTIQQPQPSTWPGSTSPSVGGGSLFLSEAFLRWASEHIDNRQGVLQRLTHGMSLIEVTDLVKDHVKDNSSSDALSTNFTAWMYTRGPSTDLAGILCELKRQYGSGSNSLQRKMPRMAPIAEVQLENGHPPTQLLFCAGSSIEHSRNASVRHADQQQRLAAMGLTPEELQYINIYKDNNTPGNCAEWRLIPDATIAISGQGPGRVTMMAMDTSDTPEIHPFCLTCVDVVNVWIRKHPRLVFVDAGNNNKIYNIGSSQLELASKQLQLSAYRARSSNQ